MAETKAADNPITLSRFLLSEQKKYTGARGEFTMLMATIQLASKVIASAVRKAGIAGLYGLHGQINVQGEDVKKLDVVANDNFIETLKVWNFDRSSNVTIVR